MSFPFLISFSLYPTSLFLFLPTPSSIPLSFSLSSLYLLSHSLLPRGMKMSSPFFSLSLSIPLPSFSIFLPTPSSIPLSLLLSSLLPPIPLPSSTWNENVFPFSSLFFLYPTSLFLNLSPYSFLYPIISSLLFYLLSHNLPRGMKMSSSSPLFLSLYPYSFFYHIISSLIFYLLSHSLFPGMKMSSPSPLFLSLSHFPFPQSFSLLLPLSHYLFSYLLPPIPQPSPWNENVFPFSSLFLSLYPYSFFYPIISSLIFYLLSHSLLPGMKMSSPSPLFLSLSHFPFLSLLLLLPLSHYLFSFTSYAMPSFTWNENVFPFSSLSLSHSILSLSFSLILLLSHYLFSYLLPPIPLPLSSSPRQLIRPLNNNSGKQDAI
ncbi:hypothetical protein C7M84_020766 [Penaeus vannamei]|uniref:Uncharacterized protein n=1 Tax=Penaeus vannamei TaxID=6689 RepID=A0A3R7NLJ4_PENVA|nr:hypothetical protein C7M84_020766 [Penaeus vannamei]